jgi:hypothetical protein
MRAAPMGQRYMQGDGGKQNRRAGEEIVFDLR